MEDFNFATYVSRFLTDKTYGDLPFFQNYTYKNLIESSLVKSEELKTYGDQFFAVQVKSPYVLFVYLLAGIFAKKEIVILSHKEPLKAVSVYQKNILFTRLLTKEDLPEITSIKKVATVDMKLPAFSILSSGSSGASKAIPLTLENVYYSSESLIDFFHMNSSNTSFLNLPHHHIGGLMILWRAFFSKSSVTVNENDSYQFISLVPLQVKRFLALPDKKNKLQDCVGVLIGGAPVSAELKIMLEENHIAYYETYGMSETCSLVMLNGIPLKNQEIKLDVKGHFLIKGKTLSPKVQLDHDGFYHTKDVGELLPDGKFVFKYRSDILFKSAGEMIDPLIVERAVKKLPWITEAVIVPIKHPEWTNASSLVYKTSDLKKTPADLKNHLATELHPHLLPRYYFAASQNLFIEGMKPKRFEIASFAQEAYFKDLFHYLYIPTENAQQLMVFFHGFMEDHTDMIPLMDNHKETSFLFIDLPGHGKTAVDKFKNREQVFSELSSLIKFYQNQSELIIYGYSMGGRVALELSSELHPALLILESASFGLSSHEEKTIRLESDRKLFNLNDYRPLEFFKKWYENPIFANYNQHSSYKLEVEKKFNHAPSEWQKSLEFFSPGVTPDLKKSISDQKIIGIVGSEDLKYKKHYQDKSLDLPLLDIIEIEGAGHNPHKTHLREIKSMILTNPFTKIFIS